MRIIAGERKGHKLLGQNLPIRPTTMKVKEALFSIIGRKIEGTQVLDCFCGLGGIGLEALSRGAGKVTFIEKDPKVAAITIKNIERLKYEEQSQLLRRDFYTAVPNLAAHNCRFDFIFVDPPYRTIEFESLLPVFSENDILAERGTLIIGHPSRLELAREAPGLILSDERRYGDTTLNFYCSTRMEKQ